MNASKMFQLFGLGAALAILLYGCGEYGQVALAQPQVASGMSLIPAGSFQMGDSFNESNSDERPVHTVSVSAFYMDQNDVTKALWDKVATWAQNHGYDIGPSDGAGKALNHPVVDVTWYAAAKWANARSEMEGLTPAYYTDSTQQTVYQTGNLDLSNDAVKWSANGYRLPTEAEWEKAARGGCAGHHFPWCDTDTIDESRANYYGDTSYNYDNGPDGFNARYATGGYPYTSPMGSFAANGYGLYDMAGNVWQWVWDRYDSSYYANSPGSDPHGPASGSYRILRGGSWHSYATYCRVSYRGHNVPGFSYTNIGFRTVLPAGR